VFKPFSSARENLNTESTERTQRAQRKPGRRTLTKRANAY
jgi:hypothetical protein